MKNHVKGSQAAAFTLLEMVAVMSIMILVIGLGFASFTIFESNDPFEKPVERLTGMSKFAINAAVLQHRTMTIAFDKEGFGLLGADFPGGSYFQVPRGMKVLVHRLGGKNWQIAEGHSWVFGEQGICEPLRIRFETSASERELAFHPLTGAMVE